MRRVSFSVVLCFLGLAVANQQLIGNGPGINRGYIFTAPKRLIAGETENVCLSLHNLVPPVHVSVDLLAISSLPSSVTPATNSEDETLASVKSTLKTGIETCLELRVSSSTQYTSAKLRLRLKFYMHPDYTVEAEKRVFIEHDALVTFVETDKAIYKPGQDVNIRVLTLKHDLKPWLKPIPKVWIENPSEVRVAQWTNVTTENGMVQLSFPLSSEPSPGTWRIKVEKSRANLIHTSSFEVRRYVLPRFQVTIGAPSYILADAKDATWKVCVRYSYGEPVKGILRLSLRPQTPIWKRKQAVADINYEEKLDSSSDGCINYTVSAQILGLPHWKVAPNNVVLYANCTEAKSGIFETATSRTPVVHQPLKLEFAPHTPKHFKPGLPYHGKLRVLRPDASSPAPNEKIQLCLRIRRKDEWQRSVVECRNFTSPNIDGFLDFIVPPQHKNIVLLSFVATAVDYPTKYYSPDKRWRVFVDQPSAYIDVEPWYSPSSSYLSVTRGYQPVVCGEKYSFNVMYTSCSSPASGSDPSEPVTFHYSINSKGDLLVFGHVKYRPRKDTLLDYSEFRNLLGGTDRTASINSSTTVHRFPLSVKITASMAPVSELLLYYVRSDGEVVTASHGIEVTQCFENKVKTVWHEDKQSPGTIAKFHLEAAPGSLCGISAVDESTRFLAASLPGRTEPNLVDREHTFARLKPFHLSSESPPLQATWTHCDKAESTDETTDEPEGPVEEIDHLPRPAAATESKQRETRKKRHSVTYNIGANYVDAIQAFDDFGVIVMSDLILESRPCPPWRSSFGRTPLSPMSQEEIDEPDRMLKAVKAMPLAFQFSGPTSAVAEASAMGQDIGYVEPMSLELRSIVRSYFPETWIWDLVLTGKEGKATIERKLPDTITDWIGNAVCISGKSGLGIASPARITAFQPFFLDYNLPYSVKRGEQLHLKVSVFNYMPYNLPVRIQLVAHDGMELVANRSSTTFFCIGSKDKAVHEYPLRPHVLGEVNITVSAELDPEHPGAIGCGPETLVFTRDQITKPILVKAEGFPVEIIKSAFLCPKNFSEDLSVSWKLELPSNELGDGEPIKDSARASVSLIGDVLGPALENLDRLVRLPMGCGEQNMILFVPNVHAIAYLDAINGQAGSEMRAKAIRNMQKGYQRELNYRHPDGSYSAFGAADEAGSGSMWLTAFVVKSFAQARSLIQIDERDLKLSVKWIVRRQLENGCFPVVGQVFHKDMKGGLREEDGSSSALTAYVLIALLESGVPLTAAMVNNALYCLEKASTSDHYADNPYPAALTTYALALLEHPRANESLRSLLTRASRQNDAVWWEDKSRPGSVGLSIEMTAYAVLSLVKLGGESNMLEALRAIRWMSKKRNAEGGFSSTQDTVLGLEALTKYALAMTNASRTDLSVIVSAADMDSIFRINNDNRMVLTRVKLPTLPTSVVVYVEGEGCLLVQSTLKYNKAKASGSEAFDLSASTETVPSANLDLMNDRCSVQRLTICARYKLPDEESNMAVLEIGMVSGFTPDRASLHELLDEHATEKKVKANVSRVPGVKRFEDNQDTVAIYFDKLTSQKTCIAFEANRENVVGDSAPASIKLYDYYQQELAVSTSYKFVDACESKNEGPVIDREPRDPSPRIMQQQDNRQIVQIPREVQKDSVEKFEEPLIVQQRSANVPPVVDVMEGSGSTEPEGDLYSPKPILPSMDLDTPDDGFLPSFVNVDHELETPRGMEGPVPVYVEAPFATPNPVVDNVFPTSTESSLLERIEEMSTTVKIDWCPRCENKVPEDIKELLCLSTNAFSVNIGPNGRSRLIFDLMHWKRLPYTKMFLDVDPACNCTFIDDHAYNIAILLTSKKDRDFTKLHRAKLDNDDSLFVHGSYVDKNSFKRARDSCTRAL